MERAKNHVKCPHCGGMVVAVVYGVPRPELAEEAGGADAALGSCLQSDENPTHRCSACGAEFCWEKPQP